MAKLKVSVRNENSNIGNKKYNNKVNADNYKEISLILKDLQNLGLPIKKAIKDFNLKDSDWDVAFGLHSQ